MPNSGQISAPAGFVPSVAVSYGTAGGAAIAVDAGHPLPVANQGVTVGYTDRSGAIVTGGLAQTFALANAERRGFWLQNLTGADLWISSLGAATVAAPALRIGAGQLYESPPHGVPGAALSIIGANAGQSFSAREW